MIKTVEKLESLIICVLIVMLLVSIVLGTVELGSTLVRMTIEPPLLLIEVAIIALCNKVVTLDIKSVPGDVIFGIAALLIALSAGYYAFAKARGEPGA